MEEKISNELKLMESAQESLRRTFNQLHDNISSVLLLNVHWKEIQVHFDSSRISIEEGAKELLSKEKEFEKRFQEIQAKQKDLERIHGAMKVKERELGGFQETLEKRAREIEVREKEQKETQEKELARMQESVQTLGKRAREIEMREQKVNESERKMKMEVKECEERDGLKDRIVKRAKRDQCWKLVDLVALQLPGIISLVNGKALQIFLNENSEYHDTMKEKVASSLQSMSDPAELVFDALQGFYPPHLKNGEVEFEGCVVKWSCNLLLEQLMKVSPVIKPHVRAEAMKLAVQWRKKMRIDADHYLEVLGFLLLLASYGLDSAFSSCMLLNCLEIVAADNNAPSLICLLGLKDKVPDVIRNLIMKKQQGHAICTPLENVLEGI